MIEIIFTYIGMKIVHLKAYYFSEENNMPFSIINIIRLSYHMANK